MVKCVYNRLKFCLTLASLAASQLVVLNRYAAFLAQALRALGTVAKKGRGVRPFVTCAYTRDGTFTSVPLIVNVQSAESVHHKLIACPAPITTPERSM